MRLIKLLLGILSITATLSMHLYAEDSLTNGWVAYYPFNGNANDESGNGHGVSLNTGATLTINRFGSPNSAYHFESVFMQFTNIPVNLAGPYSIAMWVKLNDHVGDPNVIAEMTLPNLSCNANPRLFLQYTNISYGFCNYGNNGALSISDPMHLGWHHFVVSVATGGLTQPYLDGRPSMNAVQETLWPNTELVTLTLGASGNTVTTIDYSHVDLDDVRIYNRVLSSFEVQQLYAYENPPQLNLIKAVKPSFSGLTFGTKYVLQISTNMTTWSYEGSPFIATNSTMVYPQYWDVGNWNSLYFRLQVVPYSP